MAALGKEVFGVGFLKIAAADFMTGDLRSDGEDRDSAAVTVVETVDQMQVPRATTAGADRQVAAQMRLGSGGKRRLRGARESTADRPVCGGHR